MQRMKNSFYRILTLVLAEGALYDEIWDERNEKYYKQFSEGNYSFTYIELDPAKRKRK